MSWNIVDYAELNVAPQDDFRAITRHGNQIFLLTHEGTSSVTTQIYSMPAGGTPPVDATVEFEITGELNCSGIAADDSSFYLTCGTNHRLVRVDRPPACRRCSERTPR